MGRLSTTECTYLPTFMNYERILLLLGYPWAIFVQN